MNRRHYLSTYRQKRIRLILGLLLLLAVVAVSTAYLLWSAYQQTLREAEIATRDFAALIEARLEAALRNAEAELQEIARLVPPDALRADAVPRYEKRIRAELISRITSYPEVSGIRIFDAEGNPLYSEGRGEVRRVNIADSGHFSRLRASRDLQLTFSDVITGRTSGRQVLTVAQALRGPDSVFAGMVGFGLSVDHFLDLFRSVDLGEGGNVAIYRKDDFRLVMRWPVIAANLNKPLPPDSPTRRAFDNGNDAGTMQIRAASDGRVRIYSYKAVGNYPFFVSVGMARDTVLKDWRSRSYAIRVFGAALIAALGILFLQWLRAEGSVARFNEELEARVRERTAELESFSYSVSHDQRTPLRGIAGIARILETDYASSLDHTGRDLLARLRESAQRMGGLIEDLLKLSRLTRAEVLLEPVDLAALACSVFEDLRARDPGRRVTLVLPEKLEVRGDRRLLAVALENLLGNAWKFTARKDDARIEIGVETKDGLPVYFVRDNGAGFDPAHAQQLFAPFHRLHRDDEFPGTGIGLATAQRIIRRHGGDIRAEGVPGKGAVFYFTLSA
jgi:signal transduction histidine kinase